MDFAWKLFRQAFVYSNLRKYKHIMWDRNWFYIKNLKNEIKQFLFKCHIFLWMARLLKEEDKPRDAMKCREMASSFHSWDAEVQYISPNSTCGKTKKRCWFVYYYMFHSEAQRNSSCFCLSFYFYFLCFCVFLAAREYRKFVFFVLSITTGIFCSPQGFIQAGLPHLCWIKFPKASHSFCIVFLH